ncbi:N-methyl-L-tryptophan oxidase [Hyphomicrobium sp. CS1GBMeth3]|uniref:N-methyl-L-tryptophan oxidase n=1 Tax=Hyphomicrobium sp. CS1GBMeth3 TaxID=1892845 RepID=UPI001FCCD562|nr:N-methyl-L-tryptophan oxidase [Hyphomicrobium sp. CS1GBMeth3]
MTTFDVIVAGIGAMGSQTCWHLAKRGKRVLGLDRYDIPNGMGSSHGANRIIRLSYFEHPLYVPILRRAYELWREAGQKAGEQLLYTTGSLDIGPSGSPIIEGSLESCRQHDLPHTLLTAADIGARFPGYRLPENFMAVHQPDGGFVASERAIVVAAELAMDAGAVIRGRESVLGFEPLADGEGVRVRTDRGTYEAGSLVLSTGAWIGEHVPGLKETAVPERQVLGWFRPKRPELFRLGAFPVSNLKSDLGHFYQLPAWGLPGFKIGLYHHLREKGPADALSREPNAADEQALRKGLAAFFPEADGDVLTLRTCIFTNTPDEHFILDRLPDAPQIIVASPCSGHGFKFSSAIGEILADLASGKKSAFDLSPFALSRFQGTS